MDRRTFLRLTAATGASLIEGSTVLGETDAGKADDINVALLGAGDQGRVLLNACLKIPGVRFKAICDIWTDYNLKRSSRLLEKYGHAHNTYVDYGEMLDKQNDLDAVIIATPDFWHAQHALECLNARLHVYCETEMSHTLEGARQMVEAARRSGKLLQIGRQRRSNPLYRHCFEKLLQEAKVLGRITVVDAQWNRSARRDLGWPRQYAIDHATLQKYGYESMHQLRNWRWYRKLGGGPIVAFGAHQIDIFNWFLQVPPTAVMACGGTDYHDKKTHEWYDTVMVIYEYRPPEGAVWASYQTITTNSNWGYFEGFLGDQGTLRTSEAAGQVGVYREPLAVDWEKWAEKGYLLETAQKEEEKKENEGVLDVRETMAPLRYELPVEFNDPYHKPHLENFFAAIRGKAALNCPAELGYETAATVLKVNEAVEAGCKLQFTEDEFVVG